MEVIVQKTYADMSRAAAREAANIINSKPNAVLGLATGSTPLGVS
jgi:glucosamine-6-phosphate deaminase